MYNYVHSRIHSITMYLCTYNHHSPLSTPHISQFVRLCWCFSGWLCLPPLSACQISKSLFNYSTFFMALLLVNCFHHHSFGYLTARILLSSPLLQHLAEHFLYNSEIMFDDWIFYVIYSEGSLPLWIHGDYLRPEVTYFLTGVILSNFS